MVDITPQADQTIRESPAEPVSLTTPVGVMKMPEPMMVPIIIPTPLKRVMLRLSSIFSPLPGRLLVEPVAAGGEPTGSDGDAGCSTMRPSCSGSAPVAGGERTAEGETVKLQSLAHFQTNEKNLQAFSLSCFRHWLL